LLGRLFAGLISPSLALLPLIFPVAFSAFFFGSLLVTVFVSPMLIGFDPVPLGSKVENFFPTAFRCGVCWPFVLGFFFVFMIPDSFWGGVHRRVFLRPIAFSVFFIVLLLGPPVFSF